MRIKVTGASRGIGRSIAENLELHLLFQFYDSLLTQKAVLSAMIFAAESIGSRGGAMVIDSKPTGVDMMNMIILTDPEKSYFRAVRPIPHCDEWFETVWNMDDKTFN